MSARGLTGFNYKQIVTVHFAAVSLHLSIAHTDSVAMQHTHMPIY